MRERVPVPELTEKYHADNSTCVTAASPTLQADGNVPATSIDEALTEGCTESGHGVFMLVTDNFAVQSPSSSKSRGRSLRLLNEDHTERNEGSLTDEIDTILGHRLENLDCILSQEVKRCYRLTEGIAHLHTSTRASDTQSESRTASNVRIVTLTQELHNPRYLCGVLEQ